MPDDNLMDQGEIEQLLNQAKSKTTAGDPAADPPPAADTSEAPLGQSDVESPLKSGTDAPAATGPPVADDDKPLAQDDIEELFENPRTTSTGTAPGGPARPTAEVASGPRDDATSGMAQGDVDYLLNQAEKALASIDGEASMDLPAGVSSFRLEEFSGEAASTENATLDLIRDVELDLKIELGRTHMYLEDVLKLRKGSVVPLDKLAGDPVDIYVNGRLIARGEVLVLNDNFCVRVAELIAGVNVSA